MTGAEQSRGLNMRNTLRRWAYRGDHRANRHSIRVADIAADIKAELDRTPVSTWGPWDVLADGTLILRNAVVHFPSTAQGGFLTLTSVGGISTLPAILGVDDDQLAIANV